jgi:hypothetical protein
MLLIRVTITMIFKIKKDVRQTGWDGVDWTDMAQDRNQWKALVDTILNLQVP